MIFSDIFKYFNQIAESLGLPPIVLICTIAVFLFIFIFGLVILNKVSRIRKNLIVLNSSLRTLNQRIQSEMVRLKAEINSLKKGSENSKFEFQKQGADKPVEEVSDVLNLLSKPDAQNGNQAQNNDELDLREDEATVKRGKMSTISSRILFLLSKSSRPISYSEIAKYISKDSPDYDFELILKELEQLKAEGKIISQVSAGKLYFQKKE